MQTTAERIRKGIAAKGLSVAEVSRRLGVTHQAVQSVLSGRTPGRVHYPKLSAILDCQVEWIANGTGEAPTWACAFAKIPAIPIGLTATPLPERDGADLLIPTIGRAAAAQGASVDGDTDAEPPVRIRDRWRAVKIHGDSGYPVVLDGQTVLVDPVLPCERNRIVVVHTDDGPQLKRIGDQIDDGRVMLASLNAGRDPKLVRFSDYAHAPEVVVAVVFTDSVAR